MKLTTGKFILNERGEPIPELDLVKWANWMEFANRQIGLERVGPFWISTVFLGLDHNYSGGAPVLWESVIFKTPPFDPEKSSIEYNAAECIEQRRASGSREQAESMHAEMVQVAKSRLPS